MKTLISIITLVLFSLNLGAAETAKKKTASKDKPAATESVKPSAKVAAIAKTLTPTQKTKLMTLLNEGDDKELQSFPGVGKTRAAAIKKARPFADVTDVVAVEGVGEGTFAEMVAHAKAGFPGAEKKAAADKKAPAKPKSTTKKKESK
ncbi:MAG: helix-hairpin-helix domain-containing protein [Prosthecobacter sp.]